MIMAVCHKCEEILKVDYPEMKITKKDAQLVKGFLKKLEKLNK